jgi:hypothetical protein
MSRLTWIELRIRFPLKVTVAVLAGNFYKNNDISFPRLAAKCKKDGLCANTLSPHPPWDHLLLDNSDSQELGELLSECSSFTTTPLLADC